MNEHAKPKVTKITKVDGVGEPLNTPDLLYVDVHSYTEKAEIPHGNVEFRVFLVADDYSSASLAEIEAAAIDAAKKMAAEYASRF